MELKQEIAAVRACHDLSGDIGAWLDRFTRACQVALDHGMGVLSYSFDMGDVHTPRIAHLTCVDVPDGLPAVVEQVVLSGTPGNIRRLYHPGPAAYARSRHTGDTDNAEGPFRPAWAVGVRDVIAFGATSDGGRGIAITAPSPRQTALPYRRKQALQRLAWHARGAWRTLAGLGMVDLWPTGAQTAAVVDSEGVVHDAHGRAKTTDARRLLRCVARMVDRSSRNGRAHSDEDVWRAFILGRWTLVDSFESGGRRYFVIRSNQGEATDPRGLSPREWHIAALLGRGHSSKQIGYEVGLSKGTVSYYVRRIATKLGADSRPELVRVIRELSLHLTARAGDV